jgi:hypothetical protein
MDEAFLFPGNHKKQRHEGRRYLNSRYCKMILLVQIMTGDSRLSSQLPLLQDR